MSLTQQANRTAHELQLVDFGVRDNKGRHIGAKIVRYEVDFIPQVEGVTWGYTVDEGHYFVWCPQATRDEKNYGACQNDRRCATPAEREQQIEAYLNSAKKRAMKAFGVK